MFIDKLDGQAPTAGVNHLPDELPESLYHYVTFRFVAELWNGRHAKRQVLLEHRARAADLVGRDIWLLQHPQPTSELAAAIAAPGEHQLTAALDLAPVWTPRIRIGDLVDNAVTGPATATGAFAARLRQGVADTVLETRLLGESASGGLNAAERMVSSKVPWQLIAPDNRGDLARLEPPAALATQMNAALDGGYLLVAPPRLSEDPVYWRIDPRTGDTLGIGYRRYG